MSSSDYECCVPLAGGDGQSSSFLTVTGGIICGGFGTTDWKISLSHLLEEKNTEFDLYMRCFQGVEKIPTLLSRRRAAALNPLFFFSETKNMFVDDMKCVRTANKTAQINRLCVLFQPSCWSFCLGL